MIEVHPGFFVGDEADEQQVRGETGWFFVRACKEPYHGRVLGYTGRAASKDHPEYLIARREGRLSQTPPAVRRSDGYAASRAVEGGRAA